MVKSNNSGKTASEKTLVIVESPAKARTISKFLGNNYMVEASIGHIRDLPSGKKEMPETLKGEKWAYLGVNVDSQFEPVYIVPDDKKKHVSKLKKILSECDHLYLATDEDREGEAISWHLSEVLKPTVPVHRLVFHEITREAIQEALQNPRQIDQRMVQAQETRRILDRLYGFEMSAFLWKKSLGKSAGRVQSVAVRLIVERERERIAFVSANWWDLLGMFQTAQKESLSAELVSYQGRFIPSGKDFDSTTGKIKNNDLLVLNETQVLELADTLRNSDFVVENVEVKPYTRSPSAPFTTSTLQQEANRKLGYTAKRTMRAAQSLYENGYITYMRTDSTTLSNEAVQAARSLVRAEYGPDFLPDQPRIYVNKVKNAQEAHEAIRPAGNTFRLPSQVRAELAEEQFRLFELIWKRTIASQMANSSGKQIIVTVVGGGAKFQVSGKTIDFPGFLRAYVEGSDDPTSELADQERILPNVTPGQPLKCIDLEAKTHTTQAPARFSEAALTRELERRGIGRPSTYASIIETIQDRKYVVKRTNYLVPTWNAFAVVRLMEEHFLNLVDYEFTAQMEDFLDSISRGEADQSKYLNEFYWGNGQAGLKPKLDDKIKVVDAREICTFPIAMQTLVPGESPICVRVGRYGAYLEQGDRRATLREELAPDELNLTMAKELLENSQAAEEPLGLCPETQRPVYIKQGRFGPYVQLGVIDENDKPKNSSLLKGMEPGQVSLDIALKLLSLPRNLGPHPSDGLPIEAFNGKFGPYVKWGTETRSLPSDVSVLDVSMDRALELLNQPKLRGRGRAAPKEPLRVFENSPVTEQPIKLLDGRYGPYLSDGTTNASLPKDVSAEQVTLEFALQLLAQRAAAGGSKKKATKKSSVKKTSAKKSTPKKSASKKSTAANAAKKSSTKKTAVKKNSKEASAE